MSTDGTKSETISFLFCKVLCLHYISYSYLLQRMIILYWNSDIDSLSWDWQIAPVSFSFVSCTREKNVHCTRAIVFTVFYRIFVKFVSTWISMTISSKNTGHFRSLFKTAGADKTCRFTLFESIRNIPKLFFIVSLTHAVSFTRLKWFIGLEARPTNQVCNGLEAHDSITTCFRHPARDARLTGYPHLHRSCYSWYAHLLSWMKHLQIHKHIVSL